MYIILPVHFPFIYFDLAYNTSYILNFILCEKNRHFKGIDIHYTSSPLFTLCTLLETVSLLQTQLYRCT
ncbi:unnamed protein product [Callosobruchus maculatus]|nr:unnamed protein product [Callosobruchus maculatus]